MKHVFALLMGMGLLTGAMAQVPDSIASSPYTCVYVDENSFKCERTQPSNSEVLPQLEENNSSKPERDRKFNPNNEEVDRNKPEKQIQHKYTMPEKESDSGMLESDLEDIEIDSSTIIKAGVHDKSIKDELKRRHKKQEEPNASAKENK